MSHKDQGWKHHWQAMAAVIAQERADPSLSWAVYLCDDCGSFHIEIKEPN